MNKSPLVSVGIPVFNGENYICQAVKSVMGQSYQNLEIIICDNCSSDNTLSICKDLQKSDSRIKLFRNKQNIGASRNYNLTFKLSHGEYFAWCAHDDLYHKRYIESCLSEFDKDSKIILVFSKTMNVDMHGVEIGIDPTKLNTESVKVAERFESMIQYGVKCNPVFGVTRRNILEETQLIEHHAMGDKRFLAKMVLKGPFKEIKHPLFYRRIHELQSAVMVNNYRKWAVWFDPKLKGKHLFPNISMYYDLIKSVLNEKRLNKEEKRECFLVLLRWLKNYNHMLTSDVKAYLKRKSIGCKPQRCIKLRFFR